MNPLLILLLIAAAALFFRQPVETFALHDKPDSWTEELIISHDPNKKELWDLSQAYMIDAWECRSRIDTVSPHRMITTAGGCAREAVCR